MNGRVEPLHTVRRYVYWMISNGNCTELEWSTIQGLIRDLKLWTRRTTRTVQLQIIRIKNKMRDFKVVSLSLIKISGITLDRGETAKRTHYSAADWRVCSVGVRLQLSNDRTVNLRSGPILASLVLSLLVVRPRTKIENKKKNRAWSQVTEPQFGSRLWEGST